MQLHMRRSRACVHSIVLALVVPLSAGSQIVADTTKSGTRPVAAETPRDTSRAKTTELGAAESVRLVSSYQLERERLGELGGAPQTAPMLLRSVSAYITRVEPSSRQAGIFFPELELVNNSALPWSMNDGDLWAGRGLNMRLAGGFFSRLGRVQLVFTPEITHEANKYFALHIPEIERFPIPPDRSQWAFPGYVYG